MKLYDYLSMYRGWIDFDVPDTEIDTTIYVGFDKTEEPDKDFPYMNKFTELLYKVVDVKYLVPDGIPVCDFSGLIHKNEELFRDHIKNHWKEEAQWVLEDDSGEFEYELIKEFANVINGNYGESVNKQYYETLEQCKE